MNKIKLILCFAVLMVVYPSAHAQLLNVRIGFDALVEEAIKDAVVVVESNYCIQDVKTNQKYGRNGKSHFNILQFLGCKTDKGVIVSEKVIHPWDVDGLFDKYRNNSKYRPLLDSTLVVRSLPTDKNDTIKIALDLSFNNDSRVICVNAGGSTVDGLMVSVDNSNTVNWIVWIKNSTNKDLNNRSDLEYSIVKRTIDFAIGDVVVDTPNSFNSYLGGLYISAKVVSVGLVEFSLSGFAIEKSGKWIVEPVNSEVFAMSTSDVGKEINTPELNDPDDSLTPVKEKDKEKKKKSKASKKK